MGVAALPRLSELPEEEVEVDEEEVEVAGRSSKTNSYAI